jgi:hypothetical protein
LVDVLLNKTIDERRHAPTMVATAPRAPIAAPTPVAAGAAFPAFAPDAPTVADDSKPAPSQAKSPVSIVVKHIGRGSTEYDVSLVVMLKNDGKKAIKATKGTIVIYDTFGDDLVHLNIENAKTILPGKANGDSAGTSKLTFAFIPKVILFQEGSKFDQYPIIGAVALAALRRRLSYQFQLIQQRD